MKRLILLVALLSLSITVFAEDKPNPLDKKIQELAKEMNAATDPFVKHYLNYELRYTEFKKSAEEKAKDLAYETSYKLASEYLKSKGLSTGLSTIKKIHENKDGFTKALGYIEILYSSDEPLKDSASKFFEDYAEQEMLAMATYLIPGANLYYAAGKAFHTYIQALDEAIHASNEKTLTKLLLNDPQIWSLQGKQRDDYFLSSYLRVDPTTMTSMSADFNTVKIRAFFGERGQNIAKTDNNFKQTIGWEEKSWLDSSRKSLHEQRIAVLYIFRDFLLKVVKPIKDKEIETARLKKALMDQALAVKTMLDKELSDSKMNRLREEEYSRILAQFEAREKPKLDNEIKTETELKSVRDTIAPVTAPPEKPPADYFAIKQAAYDAKIKALNDISKEFSTWQTTHRTSTKYFSNFNFDHYNQLDAVGDIKVELQSLGNGNIFSFYQPNLRYYSKESDTAQLDNYEKKIDDENTAMTDAINELQSQLDQIKTFQTKANSVGFVGHTEFDLRISNAKKYLLDTIIRSQVGRENQIIIMENTQSSYAVINEDIRKSKDQVLDYAREVEKFTERAEGLKQAHLEKQSFSYGNMDNLNALSREKEKYAKLIEDIYDKTKKLFSEYNIPFYIKKETMESQQEDTMFLDKAYDYYYQNEINSYMQKIEANKNMQLDFRQLMTITNYSIFDNKEYPLYKNRPFFMPQSEVMDERQKFESDLDDFITKANSEKNLITTFLSTWEEYKKGLLQVLGAYYDQNSITGYNPGKSIYDFIKKTDSKAASYSEYLKKYDAAVNAYKKKLQKAKSEAVKIDKEEEQRFFNERSRRQLMDITGINYTQQMTLTDCRQGKRYFPIYLATDIGRAKTVYLYLYSKLQTSITDHREIEKLVTQPFTPADQAAARREFSKETDTYLEIRTIVKQLENDLKTKSTQVAQLKDNVKSIDDSKPIEDIINGRLDSDNDGVPDSTELAAGTDPVNGNDSSGGILHNTTTIPAGSCFNFASGAIEGWTAARGQLYYGGGQIETAGSVDITGTDTIPSSGYSGGGWGDITVLTVGKKYALRWDSNYYGKFHITGNSGGLTIEYWYNPSGGVF